MYLIVSSANAMIQALYLAELMNFGRIGGYSP